MEYTIKQIAELSGVSARTLRYYDEIGLLLPKRLNSAGYRIYGKTQLDRLQQILFYRTLDFSLTTIKQILNAPDFDLTTALESQHQALLKKRQQLDTLLATVEKTLAYHKGEISMTEQEKFRAFKQQELTENEKEYGAELRESYGSDVIEAANQKRLALSQSDYEALQKTEMELLAQLQKYLREPTTELATRIFQLHRQWLQFSWPTYSLKAHQGLAQMYVADPRFTAYYDERVGQGATAALVKIIVAQ
ncbi:MerR family transcriptional regulator [Enterococcus sp. CSURQ0835]|uniref:MerR family transcriptional regulator n=1 Tax=Enterococcus sp. CSURQ0835 TaxID=2681394 RepID=UPI00135811B0|nr:MerR family transcriptional regulator [Enterococcus sp. CSURQ0835]